MTVNTRSLSQQLLSDISTFREAGEFTDLILSHEAGRFDVHRIVVCPQSSVFHKACSGNFKETFTGVIELKDISYLELKHVVDFFYRMDYDDDVFEDAEADTQSPSSLLQLHARMFALGDRYGIPGLRDVAVKKYSSRCTSSEALEFMNSIYDVYEGTATSVRPLRDVVCIRMRDRLPKVLDEEAIRTVYQRVLIEVPEFGRDLLDLYVKAPLYGNCVTCCSHQAFEALQARCKACGKGRSGWQSGFYGLR